MLTYFATSGDVAHYLDHQCVLSFCGCVLQLCPFQPSRSKSVSKFIKVILSRSYHQGHQGYNKVISWMSKNFTHTEKTKNFATLKEKNQTNYSYSFWIFNPI